MSKNRTSGRYFVGIPCTQEQQALLSPLLRTLSRHAPTAKVVPSENLHLTIHFIGSYNAPEQLIRICSEIVHHCNPGTICFDTVGTFGDNNPIVWVGTSQPAPESLQWSEICRDILPSQISKRSYIPHITIARYRNPHHEDPLPIDTADLRKHLVPFSLSGTELVLFRSYTESKGPRYEIIERFPFDTNLDRISS